MKIKFQAALVTAGITLALILEAYAQDSAGKKTNEAVTGTVQMPAGESIQASASEESGSSARAGFSGHIKDFLEDQRHIWTSPARTRFSDATWLVPLGGVAAGLFETDRQFSASLSQNPMAIRHYKTVSNLGVASLIGAGAGLYLFSYPAHNEHWRETGFLAGEAALNSLVTVESLKYSLRRERPFQGDGSGAFFHGGTSFPSEHAAAAWSIAGVIAHEYPGTLPKLFAYGMASAVSFSRVRARQHFPSDVLVGGALGYLIAQDVYSRRHDPEVGGGAWESPREFVSADEVRTPGFMGSPYVPLDSWIYPALERLAALGYVKTATLGLRPWTRRECARLLNEATELTSDLDEPAEAQELLQSLSEEFASESGLAGGDQNFDVHLESVYQRSMGISGKPLTDNYHFGQTVLNDYGRPLQQGFNTIAGTSGWASAGPFVIYVRGEYQYAPSAPAPSQSVLNFVSDVDSLPPNAPSTPIATISRLQLLDAYVGMNVANWQMSFGRQSLWWGPGEEGAMLFSNNAAPLNKMFRLNRVTPFRLPSVPGLLGDIRMEFFVGQLAGQQFINNANGGLLNSSLEGQYGKSLNPQPFLSGGKINLKMTPNFEIGVSKTTIFGGPGNPLTMKTFVQSSFAIRINGFPLGDGRTELDFWYRLPKLRNWLSIYGDAFQVDEISPLNRPYKSAFESGIYLARVPRISKVDLRIEGGTTSPINFPTCTGCFYHNGQFVNGYTNDGQLMGTWIGRASQGEMIRSNYWLSPTKKIGIELRHRKIDSQFLPEGGTQNDVALNSDFLTKSGFRFSGMLQYEHWQIPLLTTGFQTNLTVSFQLGYWPQPRAK